MTPRPPFIAALCGTSGAVLASLLINPGNAWPLAIWAVAWGITVTRRPKP